MKKGIKTRKVHRFNDKKKHAQSLISPQNVISTNSLKFSVDVIGKWKNLSFYDVLTYSCVLFISCDDYLSTSFRKLLGVHGLHPW